MQISRPSLSAVLNGRSAVSADMALRIGKLTGSAPALYVHMQAARDVWKAEQRLKEVLPQIEPAA